MLLANADGSETEAVFVLNSDVACEFHFEKLLNFHRENGGEGTIMTTPVEDPSKYGVVVSTKEGLIERFVEKPATYVGNMINAGIYLLSPAFLHRIKPKPTSIERDVFPVVAAERKLFALELPGFWMDVGQPRDYLRGNHLFLKALSSDYPEQLAHAGSFHEVNIRGRVLVHPTAKIARRLRYWAGRGDWRRLRRRDRACGSSAARC
jgi:mannose-1-phosphate guanylyltransferase